MKLNNKGITLIEIIISIALISIVLIFLFSLLVTVNDMNDDAEVNSTYLINKALILKNIEEDLSKETNEIIVKNCNINDFYTAYPSDIENNSGDYFNQEDDKNLPQDKKDKVQNARKASECIRITYSDNTYGYLGIYYYKNKESYVISYIHGNVRATRILPDFEKYNIDGRDIKNKLKLVNYNNTSCKYSNITNNCSNNDPGFYKIEVPIIGSDGKDYTILISYYGKVTVD